MACLVCSVSGLLSSAHHRLLFGPQSPLCPQRHPHTGSLPQAPFSPCPSTPTSEISEVDRRPQLAWSRPSPTGPGAHRPSTRSPTASLACSRWQTHLCAGASHGRPAAGIPCRQLSAGALCRPLAARSLCRQSAAGGCMDRGLYGQNPVHPLQRVRTLFVECSPTHMQTVRTYFKFVPSSNTC